MTRKRVLLATVALLASGALYLIVRVGFRCEPQPIATERLHAKLCYSWFSLRALTIADEGGRLFYRGIINNDYSIGNPPQKEYVDLFGSGRISSVSVNHFEPRYGFVGSQEISTRDDERIDLVLGFHGKALTKAVRVNVGRCSSWRSTSISLAGRTSRIQVCTDPSAATNISATEARAIVAGMRVPMDHERFAMGRLKESYGKGIGQYMPM